MNNNSNFQYEYLYIEEQLVSDEELKNIKKEKKEERGVYILDIFGNEEN